MSVILLSAASLMSACGKSECKKYTERFCADAKSTACADATARAKSWSSDQCRIHNNQIQIEEQSKQMDLELK